MHDTDQEKFIYRLTEITKTKEDLSLSVFNDTITFDISVNNMHAELFGLVSEFHFKIIHMFPINQYNTCYRVVVHKPFNCLLYDNGLNI